MAATQPIASPEGASTVSPRVVLLRRVGVGVALFMLGLAVSLATQEKRSVPEAGRVTELDEQPQRNSVAPSRPAVGHPGSKQSEETDLQRGLDLYQKGRTEQALQVFQRLAEESKGALAGRLALYLALCHEELGQWAHALAAFQSAAAAGSGMEVLVAQIGQARLYLRRRQPEAGASLLWPIVLRANQIGVKSPIVAEANYLLGLALAEEALPRTPNALQPMILPPPGLPWRLDRQIVWASLPPPNLSGRNPAHVVVNLEKKPAAPVLVEAELVEASAADAIERIAAAAKWTVKWTKSARQVADSRTVSLTLSNRPVQTTLEDLAEAVGLFCTIARRGADDATISDIQIATMPEGEKRALGSQRLSHAKRLLQSAIDEYPNHLLTPAAGLAAAHLEASGSHDKAIAWHQRVIDAAPHSQLAVTAHFHKGVLLRHDGKLAEAERALLQAVDAAPAHPLAPLAWLHLGQIYLEQGDWRKALSVLGRSEPTCVEVSSRAATILTIAAASLFSEEPRDASAWIAKNREVFVDDGNRQLAAFLAAYGRSRQHRHSKQRPLDANDLLVTALKAPKESVLGAFGKHLQASAFAELGMWQPAAETYAQALRDAKGPLVEEMSFRLGEALLRLHKDQEARQRLTGVAETKSVWASMAQLQLAELDRRENRHGACLDRCRRLLLEPASLPMGDILAVMGRAYESQGRFVQAAKCFAGQVPE